MRKIKLFKNRKGDDLVPYIKSKNNRHEVIAPVSSVRIGETSRELVRSRQCVDYARWVTLYVGKNETDCKMWLDKYKTTVLKLSRPYEVPA